MTQRIVQRATRAVTVGFIFRRGIKVVGIYPEIAGAQQFLNDGVIVINLSWLLNVGLIALATAFAGSTLHGRLIAEAFPVALSIKFSLSLPAIHLFGGAAGAFELSITFNFCLKLFAGGRGERKKQADSQ